MAESLQLDRPRGQDLLVPDGNVLQATEVALDTE
jgi:hypothetical protein